MTNNDNIQTVHGVTSPIVTDRAAHDENTEPPEPKHYRETSEQRLESLTEKATDPRSDKSTRE
ncbi:hypothetical protein [Allorhodopirellula solitaria]|uniref:Uncharacterized protein n=1 Tax=Allorhodopirellula solitaria TaxID=2527987 RepID=A0A5C5XWU3_9BACT|nr:hypothetical protein [Allorhodopirellula solitaria]TWT66082.1 hypothetical protein CA85_29440 [Allorhodopirellula solitaria]